MPSDLHRITALIQRLDNGLYLAEALFFPEITRAHDRGRSVIRAIRSNAAQMLTQLSPAAIYQRHAVSSPEVREITVELESPLRSVEWREPVHLTLPVVYWQHGTEMFLAYVPALRIEILAASEEERARLVSQQIMAALMREKQLVLSRLARIPHCRKLHVKTFTCPVNLPSPRQKAIAEMNEQKKEKSVLEEVGTDLTLGNLPEAFEVDHLIPPLQEALADRAPKSVLLTGPGGVGKTALVYELVRRRNDLDLNGIPFWATSGSRLVAGMTGFGMWQERCQKLCREVKKKKAILHVGNLVELMEVGKSANHAQGIASFLRPFIVRGEIVVIAECTPEQKTLIERLEPQLFQAFVEIPIEEPNRDQGKAILMSQALAMAMSRRNAAAMPITDEAMDRLDELHRRYATYSAYPGRPIRFLTNLLTDHPDGETVQSRDVTEAFSRETGLPLFLLEESERLDLEKTEKRFSSQVIGQQEAVDLIVDLMATVKAQLTRPRKPIASLMFIGPTGVGKTEMAKALAGFLFGSRERLTRFDMSEYSDPLAIQRLIGGLGQSEGLLTAKIREQPFCVVLLDEVEKAHPQFFDLLLQVLGEGRLTDASGRLADFSNSVVIMTSNLGAASYQQGAFGFTQGDPKEREQKIAKDQKEAKEHFEREVQAYVRPEMFNRIDRIVPFGPLSEEVILQITHRQLQQLNDRDGIRYRGVELRFAPEVAPWLARRGFDPRYGARPLKRAIEWDLHAPLAERMNGYASTTPLRAEIAIEGEELAITVKARTDEKGQQLGSQAISSTVAEKVQEVVSLRRKEQQLGRCSATLELINDIYRLEWVEKKIYRSNNPDRFKDAHQLSRLAKLRKIRERMAELMTQTAELEDLCRSQLYTQQPVLLEKEDAIAPLIEQWEELLLTLYLRQFRYPDDITIAIFGQPTTLLRKVTLAYLEVVHQLGGEAGVWQFLPVSEKRTRKGRTRRRLVSDPLALSHSPHIVVQQWHPPGESKGYLGEEQTVPVLEGVIGFGMVIQAPAANPLFSAEMGIHAFHAARDAGRCLVDISSLSMTGSDPKAYYQPPQGVERQGNIGTEPKRRTYWPDRGEALDEVFHRKVHYDGDQLAVLLRERMQAQLQINAEKLLTS